MTKLSSFLKSPGRDNKERYLLLFITAFLGMLICFIPSLINNKGIFLYYGDFNSQQMMFYKHAQEMVKSGNMNWDWGTDLGTDFVSSWSFYLLGSPFFWLTTLFPVGSTVYLMPWLLCLKTAVAAMTAYAYIRRFVENRDAAYIGAMLYAFSGFQTYNIFFNHFHDATAFFPLMLLGFEMLVQDDKRGPFAIAVAINAFISYFFFAQAAVFLVIYFFLRCIDDEFRINLKKFGILILEACLGALAAAVLLMPSVLEVLGNYRVNERLYGLDLVVYNDKTRLYRIFQAFFMLSDMPARINIFGVDSARWASLAAYLPLFSMAGVIAYMRTRKTRSWLTWSVIVFGIMACVPFLNSAFVLFNASYYTRWFYMPILLMCTMTAIVLAENSADLEKGYMPTMIAGLLFIGVGMLPKMEDGVKVYGKVSQYIELYYIQAAVTIVMLALLAGLIYYVRNQKGWDFLKITAVVTVIACVICNTSSVLYGVAQGSDNHDYIERAINGGDNIDMDKLEAGARYYNEDNSFYRIDTSENFDNWCMFWGLSSMRTFHSVVSTSIMDFYSELDQTRDVASRMEPKLYPLRALLSVKYYFKELPENQRKGEAEISTPETIADLEGFTYVDTQNGCNVYENQNYIPMGMAFDYFTVDDDIKAADEVDKTIMLTKALVMDYNQAQSYMGAISYYQFEDEDLTYEAYAENCGERRAECCKTFSYDTNGFKASIDLKSPKLVFFSVPYEDGWSARVNGVGTRIEKVDYGFMAVYCPAGESNIEFDYTRPGGSAGAILSCAGIAAIAGYYVWFNVKIKPGVPARRKKKNGRKDKA